CVLVAPLLDRRVRTERIWTPIALGRVGKGYVGPRVRVGDECVGVAIRRRTEIRVKVRGTHARGPLSAARVNAKRRDVGVPDVVGGKHRAAAQQRACGPNGRAWRRSRYRPGGG